MKPSHLKTPRTMNEGYWTPGYRSADFSQSPMDWQEKLVLSAALAALMAVIVILTLWG